MIKINYNNNTDSKHKINASFINKYGKTTVLNILSRADKTFTELENMSSINFYLYLDDIYNVYNCYLYANCCLVVYISFSNKKNYNILKLITNVNILIKKIKKYLNIKIIDFIDINYLFESKSNITSKINLIKSNYYLKLEVNNTKKINLYNKFLKTLKYFKSNFSIIQKPFEPNIEFIYKQSNNFFNKNNILSFVNEKINKNINLKPEFIKGLNKKLCDLFNISFNESKFLIDSYIKDINKEYEKLKINNILIKLNIENDQITIVQDSITNFKDTKIVINLILIIIYLLLENNEDLDNLDNKDINKQNLLIKNKYVEKLSNKSTRKSNKKSLKSKSKRKNQSKKSKYKSYSDTDLNTDLDIDLDLDLDLDVDMDVDLSGNSDLDNLNSKVNLSNNSTSSTNSTNSNNSNNSNIDSDIQSFKLDNVKVGTNIKYSNYIKNMREQADPFLYKTKESSKKMEL